MVHNQKASVVQVVLNSLITIVFFPAIILLASGDRHWLEGWIFSLWLLA